MYEYHRMVRRVLNEGVSKEDRTGVGTLSIFGHQAVFDIAPRFPLLTSKRTHWKSIVGELLWMLSGETNIRPLLLDGVKIWSDWPHAKYVKNTGQNVSMAEFEKMIVDSEEFALAHGDLGPVYGYQWRRWKGPDGKVFDQIAQVVHALKHNPWDRGIIMSGWNAADLKEMALRPCHTLYQWSVTPDRKLDCQLYQRSADLFLGVPFNIASASLLTCMLAQVADLKPGRLIHTFGDLHLYKNHLNQAEELLGREPYPELPTLSLSPEVTEIDDFRREHIHLEGYNPLPLISAPVAV